MVQPVGDNQDRAVELGSEAATNRTPGTATCPDTPAKENTRIPAGWLDELVIKVVYVLCSPLILRDMWRRRRERSRMSAAEQQAFDQAMTDVGENLQFLQGEASCKAPKGVDSAAPDERYRGVIAPQFHVAGGHLSHG